MFDLAILDGSDDNQPVRNKIEADNRAAARRDGREIELLAWPA